MGLQQGESAGRLDVLSAIDSMLRLAHRISKAEEMPAEEGKQVGIEVGDRRLKFSLWLAELQSVYQFLQEKAVYQRVRLSSDSLEQRKDLNLTTGNDTGPSIPANKTLKEESYSGRVVHMHSRDGVTLCQVIDFKAGFGNIRERRKSVTRRGKKKRWERRGRVEMSRNTSFKNIQAMCFSIPFQLREHVICQQLSPHSRDGRRERVPTNASKHCPQPQHKVTFAGHFSLPSTGTHGPEARVEFEIKQCGLRLCKLRCHWLKTEQKMENLCLLRRILIRVIACCATITENFAISDEEKLKDNFAIRRQKGKGSTSGRTTALRIPVLILENAFAEMVSTLGWKPRTRNGVEGWRELGTTNRGIGMFINRICSHPRIYRFHGWRLNHFPGQPVPMLDNPFSEVKFPNIQSKPPLVQLEAISSCPITCYLGEESDPHLSTTSFQAKQSQLPQPLLIRLLLQTLHQLRCPSLDTLQHLNVSLVVGGPKLNTGFEAAVNKHPQVLLCLAAFQPLFPKPVALHGVAVAQVQDLALSLVKPHTIDLGPSIQPVQVPLQSLPTLKQINTPTQLGVICKLTESTLDPFVQIIDKDIKQNWPQHRALGNTACDRPPTGFNSIHHHSLGPAIQPVLYQRRVHPSKP
ncbi:hypothetical protein QYF61_019544 [Mycteria americana]|uniref:Uncharacterized protein n=1 Tax=Mycteria americana TaxID=33587 RepID=A0AAN7NNI2_MYCAM|nr:hypothetical protein QYF61_019544 [Mycteria americana]